MSSLDLCERRGFLIILTLYVVNVHKHIFYMYFMYTTIFMYYYRYTRVCIYTHTNTHSV